MNSTKTATRIEFNIYMTNLLNHMEQYDSQKGEVF